ncbi:GntP family permease [Gordonia sp. NPDC062954]|uniref:GntP family permease n=1 Tax=Gordonia sp. NPDC062954 TaxID=3364003 RepID=UPI0037CBAEA0
MTTLQTAVLAADAELPEPIAPGWQLIVAALAGIAVIVVAITIAKVHPFLALIGGAATVGIVAGESIPTLLESFTDGFGSTAAGVGILIALGAMFAKLLADSGGADEIVDTIVGHASPRMLPWAMALVGAIIGLPMFFEIGLVLLMPVIYLVARRSGLGLITIGIPALAGLSAMHGFVPPHPGPLVAIDALGADLGTTLALGVLVAVPTIIVAGPLFGTFAGRWVTVPIPDTFAADPADGPTTRRPSFAITMFTLGRGSGMNRDTISKCTGAALPAIAGILLIVAAGGGFKQVLVDTGIGTLLADWATDVNISVLLLAWTLAALIRLATGSATVATITASSLMLGLVDGLSSGETSLVVLAIGAGSVFLSHVNDAGFWLVKEYFGMSVGQTFKTWSMMETVLSVTGLIVVLLLGLVI